MEFKGVSDLANSFLLRRDNSTIRQELVTASRELSTGVRVDLTKLFDGDFTPLASIDNKLKNSESYLRNAAEEKFRIESSQLVIETLRDSSSYIISFLSLSNMESNPNSINLYGENSKAILEDAINAINTSSGGAALFAGVDYSSPAVADADTILTALETEIQQANAITAQDVLVVVDAWFATGGGFDTIGYLGGARQAPGIKISETSSVEPLPTASDDRFRTFLASVAGAALVGSPNVLASQPEQQMTLARDSGERILSVQEQLISLQAELGIQENRIARAESETLTKIDGLRLAKSDLIGVDPFEAATALQSAETQLQSLYAITSRLSGLTLTEYLR